MGKIKYIEEVRQFFRKSPVVSFTSVRNIIAKHKGNTSYAYLLVNHLLKKKEIRKITKGFYTIHEDPTIAVFCFKPAYIGLQDALSIHELWDQKTNPVIITTKKVRQGIRKILDSNVILKRIKPEYFFGIEYVKYGDFYIPVSDVEKTFIDLIYFRVRIDRDLLKNFRKRIDMKKLKRYVKKYPRDIADRIVTRV